MGLKEIVYFTDGKKNVLKVKMCDTLLKKMMGLMFKKKSPPLLFVFNKEKKLSIHSLFCKPFKAIWLDNKMKTTRIVVVKRWRLNISGSGKYLLEIPELLEDNKFSSVKSLVGNRNI